MPQLLKPRAGWTNEPCSEKRKGEGEMRTTGSLSFNSKAFTLVELLIVTVILAGVAVMILPAQSRARDHARRISCSNNHRQLVLASSMYLYDYDGVIFTASAARLNYVLLLEGYTSRRAGEYNTEGVQYLGRRDPALTCPSLDTVEQSEAWEGNYYYFYPFPMIAVAPSEAIERSTTPCSGNNHRIFVLTPHKATDPANHWFYTETLTSGGMQATRMEAGDVTGNSPGRPVHLRHNNAANMSFLDGHVETVDIERLKTVGPVPFRVARGADLNIVNF